MLSFTLRPPASLTSSVVSSNRDVSDSRAGCHSASTGMARSTCPQDGLKSPRATTRPPDHPSTGQCTPVPDIASSFAVSTHASHCVHQYRRSLPCPRFTEWSKQYGDVFSVRVAYWPSSACSLTKDNTYSSKLAIKRW